MVAGPIKNELKGIQVLYSDHLALTLYGEIRHHHSSVWMDIIQGPVQRDLEWCPFKSLKSVAIGKRTAVSIHSYELDLVRMRIDIDITSQPTRQHSLIFTSRP